MTLLQLGIGIVNDVVDAPRDAGRKAGKPIPAGLVAPSVARAAALVCFAAGTALAAASSPAAGLLALAVVGIGLAYDLRLKGTAWSWLPFALGIPLLPVFGWVGAGAALPVAFAILLPVAVVAGAVLAIGNALVDVDRDRGAGVSSIAVAVGPGRAGGLMVGLLAVIAAVAVASAAAVGGSWPGLAVIAVSGAIPVVAAAASLGSSSDRRERAWQAEAVGLAVLATAWLATVLPATPG